MIEAHVKTWEVYSTLNGNIYVRVPGSRMSAYIGNVKPERADSSEFVPVSDRVECEVLGRVVFDRDSE